MPYNLIEHIIILMAVVKPFLCYFYDLHWLMLLPSLLWQILLPKFMADVIAIIVWLILLPLVIF